MDFLSYCCFLYSVLLFEGLKTGSGDGFLKITVLYIVFWATVELKIDTFLLLGVGFDERRSRAELCRPCKWKDG